MAKTFCPMYQTNFTLHFTAFLLSDPEVWGAIVAKDFSLLLGVNLFTPKSRMRAVSLLL